MATILIVDSRRDHRQPLISLLGDRGHRVLEAPDGERAREIARAEKPDLVLTDVPLPGMGGRQVVMPADDELPPAEVREKRRGVRYFVPRAEASDALMGVIEAALARLASVPNTVPNTVPDTVSHTVAAPVAVEAHAAAAMTARVRAPSSRIRRRLADLEDINLEMAKRLEVSLQQLEDARSALEEEVNKRIWAETELTRANLQLRERAVRDALTGVHNRGYFEESLQREESRARRTAQPLGIVMIDIDHFKRCNDTYGHAAGDAVLRAVGQHILSLTRAEDTFCRYGGEEFVLIMVDTTERGALERAEALRAAVEGLSIEHEGQKIAVTLSVGVAMIPDHAADGTGALRAADAALYRAKQGGRNRVVIAEGAADA